MSEELRNEILTYFSIDPELDEYEKMMHLFRIALDNRYNVVSPENVERLQLLVQEADVASDCLRLGKEVDVNTQNHLKEASEAVEADLNRCEAFLKDLKEIVDAEIEAAAKRVTPYAEKNKEFKINGEKWSPDFTLQELKRAQEDCTRDNYALHTTEGAYDYAHLINEELRKKENRKNALKGILGALGVTALIAFILWSAKSCNKLEDTDNKGKTDKPDSSMSDTLLPETTTAPTPDLTEPAEETVVDETKELIELKDIKDFDLNKEEDFENYSQYLTDLYNEDRNNVGVDKTITAEDIKEALLFANCHTVNNPVEINSLDQYNNYVKKLGKIAKVVGLQGVINSSNYHAYFVDENLFAKLINKANAALPEEARISIEDFASCKEDKGYNILAIIDTARNEMRNNENVEKRYGYTALYYEVGVDTFVTHLILSSDGNEVNPRIAVLGLYSEDTAYPFSLVCRYNSDTDFGLNTDEGICPQAFHEFIENPIDAVKRIDLKLAALDNKLVIASKEEKDKINEEINYLSYLKSEIETGNNPCFWYGRYPVAIFGLSSNERAR